jgi:hypothetical protein
MIPAIGFIIGFYVITRSLEMLSAPRFVIWIMAPLTMIVSTLGMYVLLQSGSSVPSMPGLR